MSHSSNPPHGLLEGAEFYYIKKSVFTLQMGLERLASYE